MFFIIKLEFKTKRFRGFVLSGYFKLLETILVKGPRTPENILRLMLYKNQKKRALIQRNNPHLHRTVANKTLWGIETLLSI